MEADDVLEPLRAIGMSGYEAKAYVALVAAGRPMNGYAVAKHSGIPRSTVYQTLEKLMARGAAFEVRSDDDSTLYVALPTEALIRRLREKFDSQLDELGTVLPTVRATRPSHLLHTLEGRDAVLDRANDLLQVARRTVDVSAWAEELRDLEPALRRVDQRGVETSVVSFGEGFSPIGHTYPHIFSSADVVLRRVGCRLLVVTVDNEQVLIGGVISNGSMWGVFSDDPAVVLVAVEYIHHDIAFQILVEHLGVDEVEKLFRTDPTLTRLATGHRAPALQRRAAN
jgi:HTH-type transcriptional regulator, sugar sensing transcriptional regulator